MRRVFHPAYAGRAVDFITRHHEEPFFTMIALNAVHNFFWAVARRHNHVYLTDNGGSTCNYVHNGDLRGTKYTL